jgi:hypothetical protein
VTPQTIATILSGVRLSLVSEKQTQADIAEFFTGRGIEFTREHRLSDSDIPDFMVGSVVIEVKANRAKANQTTRQLERYAEHPEVSAIILVSNRAMNVPSRINEKPVLLLSTGRAWL